MCGVLHVLQNMHHLLVALHVLQICTIEDVRRAAQFLSFVLSTCFTRQIMLPFCFRSSGPACVM